MAVRYAFLFFVLFCFVFANTQLSNVSYIWWHVHYLSLVTFLQLFGAQSTQGPAPHSLFLWIKCIKVKSQIKGIDFVFNVV